MDSSYLELHLPGYLQNALDLFIIGKQKHQAGGYLRFDCDYCFLQSSINCAEVDNDISSEQAWYLRNKYLGLSKETF
ncbi:MAG: hypothetical protein PUC50_14380 [Bacteroidales bacterium]|nr:hypothetical protein [Bacteroidales bacterium]